MSDEKKIISNPDQLSSELARLKRESSTSDAQEKRSQSIYASSDNITKGKIITAPGIGNVKKKIQPKLASFPNQTVRMAPQINSPFFEPTNFSLPLERMTRNAWCRFYYRTDPVVASSLELHTDYPLTDYVNDCPVSEIKGFFDQMAFEQLDIMQLLHNIGLEYWKIGDVFPCGQFDADRGVWDHFLLLNPDYVEVQRSMLSSTPQISLIPDDKLKQIVNSNGRGEYANQFSNLSQDVIQAIRSGQNIQLPPENVSHIAHKASDYEVYGTPLLNRCFKTLLYKDKIRTAQQAIVERHITPIRIFKLGDPAGEPVTQDEIEDFRNLLAQAELDYNHTIVYHAHMDFLATNNTQTIFQLAQEYDFFRYELAAGLMVNETFITGEGPNFATASVNLEVLERRYKTYLMMLKRWIENKVYAPVAKWHGWEELPKSQINHNYRIKGENYRLIYPKVSWKGREIIDYKEDAPRIYMEAVEKDMISKHTALEKLGLNYDTEMTRIAQEKQDQKLIQSGEGFTGDEANYGGFSSEINAPNPEAIPGGSGIFEQENGSPGGTPDVSSMGLKVPKQ